MFPKNSQHRNDLRIVPSFLLQLQVGYKKQDVNQNQFLPFQDADATLAHRKETKFPQRQVAAPHPTQLSPSQNPDYMRAGAVITKPNHRTPPIPNQKSSERLLNTPSWL
jgi:hypothetical protein